MATGGHNVHPHLRLVGIYPHHEPIPRRVWALWAVSLVFSLCVLLAILAAR